MFYIQVKWSVTVTYRFRLREDWLCCELNYSFLLYQRIALDLFKKKMTTLRKTRNSLSRSYFDQSLLNDSTDKDLKNNESDISSVVSDLNEEISRNNSSCTFSEDESSPKKKRKVYEPPKIVDNTDVFCWRCHKPGCCINCSSCPRVFHLRCAQLDKVPTDFWPCIECDSVQRAEAVSTRGLTVNVLAELLLYALDRMKSYPGSEEFCSPVDIKVYDNYKDYIVKPMDLSQLEIKIKKMQYGSTEAFVSDAKWMVHNSYIYNSAQSSITIMARGILKLAKQECEEIDNCHYCYRHAHTLPPDKWFIEPCEKPHLLIWARLRGFPYWPAKVMRITGQGIDVRFFGDHNRSIISPTTCYLYCKKMPSRAGDVKSPGLELALEEIEAHIMKLESKFKCFEYAAYRTAINPGLIEHYISKMLPKCDVGRLTTDLIGENVNKEQGQKSKDITRLSKPEILKTINILGKEEVLKHKINSPPNNGPILISDAIKVNTASNFAKSEIASKDKEIKQKINQEILLKKTVKKRVEKVKPELQTNKSEGNPNKKIKMSEEVKEDRFNNELNRLRAQKNAREAVHKFKKINKAVKVPISNKFNRKIPKKKGKSPTLFQNVNPQISKSVKGKSKKNKPTYSYERNDNSKLTDVKVIKKNMNNKITQKSIKNIYILRSCPLNRGMHLNNELNQDVFESNVGIDHNKNICNKFPKIIENFNENPVRLPKKVQNLMDIKTTININRLTDLSLATVLGGRKYIKSSVVIDKLSDNDYNKYSKSSANNRENGRCIIVDKGIKDSSSETSEDEEDNVDVTPYNNLTTEEIYRIIGENYRIDQPQKIIQTEKLLYLKNEHEVSIKNASKEQKSTDQNNTKSQFNEQESLVAEETVSESLTLNNETCTSRINKSDSVVVSTTDAGMKPPSFDAGVSVAQIANEEGVSSTVKKQKNYDILNESIKKKPLLAAPRKKIKRLMKRNKACTDEELIRFRKEATKFVDDQIDNVKNVDNFLQFTTGLNGLLNKSMRYNLEANDLLTGIGLKSTLYENKKKEKIRKRMKEYESETEELLHELKMKQWCKFCMKEAKFHCCWNISYCSYECQAEHWAEHYQNCGQFNHSESADTNTLSDSNRCDEEYSELSQQSTSANPSFVKNPTALQGLPLQTLTQDILINLPSNFIINNVANDNLITTQTAEKSIDENKNESYPPDPGLQENLQKSPVKFNEKVAEKFEFPLLILQRPSLHSEAKALENTNILITVPSLNLNNYMQNQSSIGGTNSADKFEDRTNETVDINDSNPEGKSGDKNMITPLLTELLSNNSSSSCDKINGKEQEQMNSDLFHFINGVSENKNTDSRENKNGVRLDRNRSVSLKCTESDNVQKNDFNLSEKNISMNNNPSLYNQCNKHVFKPIKC